MPRAAKPKPPAEPAVNDLLKDFPFRVDVVATDHVHPNSYNPNRQDDLTRKATRESIATFGFLDPVTVVAHAELAGHYTIVDGEHRWREAVDLGLERVPVVILEVDAPTAMKLTVVLNQTGEPDRAALGALLKTLSEQQPDDWRTALAFDEDALAGLLELGATWTPPDDRGGGEPGAGADAGAGLGGDPDEGEVWVTIEARLPPGVLEVWEHARARAVEAGDVGDHDDEKVAAGMLVEVLAAAYLAG